MKLQSPRIERAAWRLIKARLRASRTLKKEYKRLRKSRKRQTSAGGVIPTVLFVGWLSFALLGLAVQADWQSRLGFLAQTLFATGLWLFSASMLKAPGSEWWTLIHYPVSDESILRRHRRIRCLAFLKWSVVLLAGFAGTLHSWPAHYGFQHVVLKSALALGLAGLQTMALLSAAFWLTRFRLPHWVVLLAGALFLSPLLIMATREFLAGIVSQVPSSLFLLSPAGWIPYALHRGLLEGHPWALAALAPPFLAAICLPREARTWLSRQLAFWRQFVETPAREPADSAQQEVAEAEDIERETGLGSVPLPAQAGTFARANAQSARSELRSRHFMRPLEWDRTGPLEYLLAAWLTQRERVIIDVGRMRPPALTKNWITSVVLLAVLAVAIHAYTRENTMPLIGVGGLVLIFFSTHGSSEMLARTLSACNVVPFHALLPVGYWETSRAEFKTHVVRWLPWFPLVLGYAMLAAREPFSIGGKFDSFPLSARVPLLLFFGKPLSIGIGMVCGGGQSNLSFWSKKAFLIILTVLLYGSVLMTFVLAEDALVLWIFGLGVAVVPLVLWALMGRAYGRWKVDMVYKGVE